MIVTNQKPDLRTMSREQLLEYGRRGHAEDIAATSEALRRFRERHPEFRPANVVPFRRTTEGKGESA